MMRLAVMIKASFAWRESCLRERSRYTTNPSPPRIINVVMIRLTARSSRYATKFVEKSESPAFTLEEQRDLYETPEKLHDAPQVQEIERLLQDPLFFQTDLASQQQGRHSGYGHVPEPTNLNQEQDD